MKVIVALIRLVYYDISCIGLELEVADAVKFYVFHHVWKHPLDEDGAYFARIVFLAAQSLGYIPYKVPKVKGGKSGLQPDGYRYMLPVIGPLSDSIKEFSQFLIVIDIWGHGMSHIFHDGGDCVLSSLFLFTQKLLAALGI